MLEKVFTRRATLALLGGAAALAQPAIGFGQSKPLKKARIMVAGTNALSIGYYFLTVPTALKFWRDEGLDVEVFPAPTGGSMVAVQQLAAGGIDFAMMDVNGVMQSNTASNGVPLLPLVTTGVIDSAVVVPESSPIKSVTDLKGKAIGIINLTGGGMMLLRSLLKKNGMDMDKDVQVLPVGFGASALDALKSDRVQALIFWGSALVAFENIGMKFRYFRDADWKSMPGYTLVTSQAMMDKDPALAEAITRVVARALTYCDASPECALKAHWRQYPDTKPTGVDEATATQRDLAILKFLLQGAHDAMDMMGGKGWAGATTEPFEKYQNFLFDSGVIKSKVPPKNYVVRVPGFFERANNFDARAVQAAAKTCAIG